MVEAARELKPETLSIDGELVGAGKNGIADFECLHSPAFDHQAFLYGFDIMELNGEDLRPRTLVERKRALVALLRNASPGLRYCERVDGDGAALFEAAFRMGLEGIVSKRLDSRYRSRRCKSWVKVNPGAHGCIRLREGG